MVNLAAHPSLWPVLAGVIALALAPLAFFLWFAYTRDKLNPEPHGLVLRVFMLGLLAFIPAFLCRQLIPLPYWLTGVLLAPVVDELAKFAVVKTTVYHIESSMNRWTALSLLPWLASVLPPWRWWGRWCRPI